MPFRTLGNRASILGAALILSLTFSGSLQADLTRALAEKHLERRSALALENASTAYQRARTAYEKGESEEAASALAEVQESVSLAHTSLKATGKDARKSPKWFKRAEIDTRQLLRKLDGFHDAMSFSDRALIGAVKATVQQVHEELLRELMQGKKR
jgi:hypothetical protein